MLAGNMSGDATRRTPPSASKDGPLGRSSAPALGWGKILALLAWGFLVLAFAAGGLADVTNLWWLVLVFGAAVPVLFVALQNRGSRGDGSLADREAEGERELLDALGEHRELSPASAAMLTTLTVNQASGILEALARKGHLDATARDGSILYALRERDRRSVTRPATAPVAGTPQDTAPAVARDAQPPAEPLSRRELEVLRLMALGRTNAEISRELFVAVGTVKAHANNIYRKLAAANRSEAVSKARSLGLLG